MALHFEVLIIASFLGKLYDILKNNKSFRVLIVLVLTLGLSVFIGYRSLNMGIDTVTYYHQYQRGGFGFDYTEIGFPVIIGVCRLIGLNYSQFFTVLSLITMFGVVSFVLWKVEMNHFLYLFLYISSCSFLYSTSAVRFFMALSWAIISMYYFNDKKIKRAIIFMLIGATFHFTVLMILPVFIIAKIKSLKKYLTIIFWIGTFFIMSNFAIHFLKGVIPAKYSYIFLKSTNSLGISTVKMAIELLVLYLFRNRVKINKDLYYFLMRVMGFAIIYDFFPLSYRSVWYFKFPAWFLWAILIDNLKLSDERVDRSNAIIIESAVIVIYFVYYYFMLRGVGTNQNLIPYVFAKW